MKKEDKKTDKPEPGQNKENMPVQKEDAAEKRGFPGYPHYPASEDIYNNEEEVDVDPEKFVENENDEVKSRKEKPKK